MKPSILVIPGGAAVLCVIALAGYLLGAKSCSSERTSQEAQIATYKNFLGVVRQQREQRAQLVTGLETYVGRTLGGKLETVDSRLRERLNKIGEEVQVRNLAVSTGRALPQPTPAKGRYSKRGERAVRDEPDFIELDGSVTGDATLEQALRLVHRIQSEPWLKRVHQFKLEPRNNGDRFNVTVRLTTLFLPGQEPHELPSQAYDAEGFAPYTVLASLNPFRLPPPPQPTPPAPVPPPQPQAAPVQVYAYGQWKVTGVVESAAGVEVWLLNGTTMESRRLVLGESLQQAQLVAAAGEQAEFRLGDDHFMIAIGKSLDDRTPIKR